MLDLDDAGCLVGMKVLGIRLRGASGTEAVQARCTGAVVA